VFHLLAEESSYPLVFHCAGGRDRTGLTAALVLTAAGVSWPDVGEDYLLSTQYLQTASPAAYRSMGIEDPAPLLEPLRLRDEHLLHSVDWIAREHQGVPAYLRHIGISDEEMAQFRDLFVTPAA